MSTEPETVSREGPPPSETGRSIDPLTARVLTLRSSRSDRSALRRAAHSRTRYYALPLIGPYLRWGQDDSAFRFAALCAAFDKVANSQDMRVGRTLRLADPKGGQTDSPVGRRLFAMQRQPLQLADSTMRSLLSITEPKALDWNDLLWLYRGWDHPDLTRRVENRQRLLRDFYTFVPKETDSSPASAAESTN